MPEKGHGWFLRYTHRGRFQYLQLSLESHRLLVKEALAAAREVWIELRRIRGNDHPQLIWRMRGAPDQVVRSCL